MQDIQEPEVVKEDLILRRDKDNPTLAKVDNTGTELKAAAFTPQQMRVVEVSQALEPAYAKASTLELSEAEIQALMAPFPDNIVEVRPHDGLIYIPHIHISNRLNQILHPGKWALVCRRHWLEGTTMYGEYVLLVRGCFVGESVGGHPYQPNNPKTNYSDTLESTAAEALRRICGKRLSCGSQVWEPEYARQWLAKHAEQVGGRGPWRKKQNGGSTPKAAPVAKAAPFTPPDADEVPMNYPAEVEAETEAAMGKALKTMKNGQQSAIGVLEKLTSKPTKKGGTRYGVMLDGERWFNHFDSKIQDDCESLKGQKVIIQYVEAQYGTGDNVKTSRDLKTIEPNTVPF